MCGLLVRDEPPQFRKTRLRAEKFADSGELIGLSIQAARAVAADHGLLVRVVKDDVVSDVPVALTADLRANRINVETAAGVVIRIDGVH